MLYASTLDPAGTNRLDFTGDAGALRAEGDRLRRASWEDPTSVMLAVRTNLFEAPAVTWGDVEASGDAITYDECVNACERDFLDAIVNDRAPSIGPHEGTPSVEVANAIYLSAVTDTPVTLPLDAGAYDEAFARMCSGELSLPTIA